MQEWEPPDDSVNVGLVVLFVLLGMIYSTEINCQFNLEPSQFGRLFGLFLMTYPYVLTKK